MKIALLANRSSIHSVRWANVLAAVGHEVHLLSLHSGGERLDGRITVHTLPFGAPAGYFLNSRLARSRLREIGPDVLNTHFASGYGTLGRLTGFSPNVLSVWGQDVYRFPAVSYIHARVVTANLRCASWVCSTSHAMADQVARLTDVPRLAVVPFGVDTTRFHPPAKCRSSTEIVIGTVKALAKVYGVDVLVRAFAMAKDDIEQTDPSLASRLRLHIVGDGPDRSALEALSSDLRIANVTRFFGHVPHDIVPDHLRALDIFAALSRDESFGVAVVEAAACGLPVVVSNVGGLPEVVAEGLTGYVVEHDCHIAAAAALVQLIRHPALRGALGAAGRRRAEELYSWDASVAALIDVYRSAVHLHGANASSSHEDSTA